MPLHSDIHSTKEIGIAEILIDHIHIDWANSFLFLDLQIGLEFFEEVIPLTNIYYLSSKRSKGLITHCNLINTEYTLFITSPELDIKLSKSSLDIYKDNLPVLYGWFIEFQKSFHQYKIYFIRSISPYSPFPDSADVFKGFFHTNPKKEFDLKKFMLINIPSGNLTLVKVIDTYVSCNNYNYTFKILIGELILDSIHCYVYVIHLGDLIDLQSEKAFQNNLFFSYHNKLLPIPSIPITKSSEFHIPNFDLHTSFISRSQLLCMHVLSKSTLSNLNTAPNHLEYDQNEFIAVSDTLFNESDHSIFSQDNENLMPYKFLIYPYDTSSLVSGFFNEVDDYDYQEDLQRLENEMDKNRKLEIEPVVFPDYWESLDTSEKYEDNESLAEWYFGQGSSDLNNNYEDSDPNANYFYSNKSAAQKFISNIFCISINKGYATFEVIREGSFQRKICPIILNPFVSGISVFTGVLPISDIGDFSFAFVEKCPKKILRRFLREVMSFEKYHILESNNCFICVECKIHKYLLYMNNPNTINPTLIYKK